MEIGIYSFAEMTPDEARVHRPQVVRVDGKNRPLPDDSLEVPGPVLHSLPAKGPGEAGVA
jgi:hypothetical protein